MAMRDPNAADGPPRLRLNPILCDGVGYCAEVVPELIRLDDWGYPIVERRPLEDGRLQRLARRAVAQCPRVALALTAAEDTRGS
jgi:ferredoxin